MDPLTQGLLGGVAAQAFFGGRLPRSAWLVGLASGMAADLDIFIRPASDPLGGLTHHRHFTHALAFAPVGALLCALPFLLWPKREEGRPAIGGAFRGSRWAVYGAALAAYLTHGPLDACTSYGTMLWWPFTGARVSWDVVGIIDPVVTLSLLVALAWSAWAKRPRIALAGLLVVLAYFGLGLAQRERARGVQRELAAARGDVIERSRLMPQPLTLLLWRSIYESDGRMRADSIRAPFFGETTVWAGGSAPVARLEDLFAGRVCTDEERCAYERFAWFADGYVALDASDPGVVGDMRYAMAPDRFASLWGMRIPGPAGGKPMFGGLPGARGDGAQRMWSALLGRDKGYVPVKDAVERIRREAASSAPARPATTPAPAAAP